ncbi:hypothetical protein [uncultured Corynebacterium sp.]|uniref:hypothetical protein n=1 Tax=uncultured Corynebacterium sp. TaxID=159447 RepID=UPI0025E4D65C|nr:hypothetical protein [uncultured Corynebacterium sp.]
MKNTSYRDQFQATSRPLWLSLDSFFNESPPEDLGAFLPPHTPPHDIPAHDPLLSEVVSTECPDGLIDEVLWNLIGDTTESPYFTP